jgi:hypothetical protein
MGTKNNPGKYDCYEKAESDEPMFILLARDKHAAQIVRLWAGLHIHEGEEGRTKAMEALDVARDMDVYRSKLTTGRNPHPSFLDGMPILFPKGCDSIPWDIIEPHAKQAERSHHQTLEELKKRGGLTVCEAVAILEDRAWHRMDAAEALYKLTEIIIAAGKEKSP